MSNEWEMVRLGDVLVCQTKSKIKAGYGSDFGKYKFFTSSADQTKFIDVDSYCEEAIIIGSGGNANIHYCSDPFSTSTDCFVYYAKNKNICLDTIYRFMKGNIHILQEGFKGAGLKHISKRFIENIIITLPKSFSKQQEIASILDKASELVKKRKEQLTELDTLAESIFYDMFGDPVTNEKGWEVCSVIERTKCIVPGRDKPKSFTGDIPWVTTADLNPLSYTSKANLFLSRDEVAQVKAKIIPKGSVIMTCVGDLGIVSITGNEMVINQQLHAFICNDTINNVFLAYNLFHRKDFMYKMASSTTVPYMNKTICNSIPIILPPLSLQQQFAERIEKIEAQKQKVKTALKESEDLFQRLMQDLFNPMQS